MGIDHHPQQEELYAQGSEFEIIGELLPYLQHKTFIDIGSEKGVFARFLMNHELNGVMFEPCPKHHAVLEDLAQNHNCLFFPYAIDSTDRDAQFHIACDEKGETLDYYHSLHYLSDDPRVNHSKKMAVTCRSLKSLYDQGVISERIGIVKIDTEGNDLQVIKGMSGILPEVLVCEFFTKGLYAGWEEAAPEGLISAVQETLGYDHYVAIKRYHEGELISSGPCVFLESQWGNLIFIKNDIYAMAFDKLKTIIAASEKKLFDFQNDKGKSNRYEDLLTSLNHEIEILRRVCEERLELINFLSEEAEKRGKIIDQLKNQLNAV